MSNKKAVKKKPTDLFLECRCGAKARVFELEHSFMVHCAACGALTFFHNPELLERLRLGGQLCPHRPEPKLCPGGHTTWCSICRIRSFIYDS
ncbi:hypothetical protein ACFLXC_03960 [Chloroflexota bacterium]